MSDIAAPSQTLSRGLRILDLLAANDRPLSIAEIAADMGVHRSVAYRLVRTLEDHALVVRNAGGALVIGPHIATLARSVAPALQSEAPAVLQGLAEDLGTTAFLVVLDGLECVTLLTAEPRHAVASIAQRPGSRHSLLAGAPGVSIQSLLTAADRDTLGLGPEAESVAAARHAGYSRSRGEVLPGVTAIAAPVGGAVRASVAVMFVSRDDEAAVADAVRSAAAALALSNR